MNQNKMERSENLTPEPICPNENTSDFVKMAGDGAQEISAVTVTETDTVTDELDRDAGIPTTMLTPPPTSEPLLLNGSSRSSTNGSDLQQFTGDDEIAQLQLLTASSPSPLLSLPPPSDRVDDEHSCHSTNSDSIDSKSLIINEGPEDSSDNVSNLVDRSIVDDCAIDAESAASTQDEDKSEEKDDQDNLEDDSTAAAAVATTAATPTEMLYDACSKLQTDECDGTHSEDDEITSTAEHMSANQSSQDVANEVDVDNDTIPNADSDDSRHEIKSTLSPEIETQTESNADPITEPACASVMDDAVPSHLINGVQQSPSPAVPSTEITHEQHDQPPLSPYDAADEPDHCLANDLHIEHKTLKRKLSTASADADDSYETLKKQTKYDQTAADAATDVAAVAATSSIDFNEIDNVNDNDSNQIVHLKADSISNRVTQHNQIPVRCDIQNVSNSPSSIDVEADKTLSLKHVENIRADEVIPNADADANVNVNVDASANADGVDVNVNVNVDGMDELPATKDTIHVNDDDDTHDHKHMNGHINSQAEMNSLAEIVAEEELKTLSEQQYNQQLSSAYCTVEKTTTELEPKVAPSSLSLSFLSSSSSLSQPQSPSEKGDEDDDVLHISDTTNLNLDPEPVLNRIEANHSTDAYQIKETHTTMAEQRLDTAATDNINCDRTIVSAPTAIDGIVNNSVVDIMNCSNTNDIRNATPSPQPPPLPPPPPPSSPHNRNKLVNLQNRRSIKSIDNRINQQPLNQLTANSASPAHFRVRRQVFLCSACGTYYEKWNLFYHIREVHNKFICLYENCLGIFSSAEKLVVHLESKHVRRPHIYERTDDLLRIVHNQCFLMCCDCEHIFTENDANDVTGHVCETFKRPCLVCGLKTHKSNCSVLNSRKAIKLKSKRSTTTEPPAPTNPMVSMQQHQMQSHLHTQPLVPINSNLNLHSHPNHMTQQQTFLRNALLGQESRFNQHGQPGIATTAPMLVSLPMPPHSSQMTMPLQHQSQHQPHPQPHQQFPTPCSAACFNGNIVQSASVSLNDHYTQMCFVLLFFIKPMVFSLAFAFQLVALLGSEVFHEHHFDARRFTQILQSE